MLSKIGFSPAAVWDMTHAEVAAWIDSYLVSQGIKKQSDSTTYILKRRPKASNVMKKAI